MLKKIMAVLFSLGFFLAFSQELPENTRQQLEHLAELTEEETENDELLQQLAFLIEDPLSLNTATGDDLRQFPFLTDLQIQNFLQYRMLLGNLLSVYELQSIPGWDVYTIRRLLPFVQINNPVSLNDTFLARFKNGEHSLLMRFSRVIEKAKGYSRVLANHYSGGRNAYLMRYRYQYKNLLQYGVTADHDAGEPLFTSNNQKGFDFYSAHLFVRNLGVVKSLAVGDYTVNLGQGLIQWQSLAFKKSSEVINIKRQSPVLKPYSSAGEAFFNRGIAASFQKGKWSAAMFGSVKNVSASLDTDSVGTEVFTSFQNSGLHRTASEIRNKNNIRQTSFGGRLGYQYHNFAVGINAVQYRFSKPYQKREEPYNLFAWSGSSWANASVDYSATHKNIHFFGEAAVDKNLNKAFVNGAMLSVDQRVDVSILYRNISEKYSAVYGNAFTENIQPANENGLYAGISIRPVSAIRLNGYADFYQFPWLKFRADAPSLGKDFLAQLTYEPNKTISVYTRYRYESKQINEAKENYFINYLLAKPRQNWRVHFSYTLSPNFIFRSRLDAVWYDKKGAKAEEGFLFYTELHYKPLSGVSGNIRLQYFETEGYNSRIYAYENDVLFRYSTPAFFDKGYRLYTNLNLDINKKISFWLRLAQTIYINKDVTGTNLEELPGNRRSEIRMQCLIKF